LFFFFHPAQKIPLIAKEHPLQIVCALSNTIRFAAVMEKPMVTHVRQNVPALKAGQKASVNKLIGGC
jgi:hypothetical protein